MTLSTVIKREPVREVILAFDWSGAAERAFADVRLPDGSIVRRVDQKVHEQAPKNAAKALRKAT